jgi:hypothetical protein
MCSNLLQNFYLLKRSLFMKKKLLSKICAICCFLVGITVIANAQPGKLINGTIMSAADGKPIVAATIQILPGTMTVLSDADGRFSFVKAEAKSIRVSYVGFLAVDINLSKESEFSIIRLESNANPMEDVVVVGYSQQKKVNLTGAVQTIRFTDAVNQPVTNSAQLLYGKVSGVQLTQGNGLPGNDNSSIVIRPGKASC